MTTHRLRDVALVLTSNVDKIIVPDEQPVRLCNYVDVYKNNYIHKDLPFKLGSATSAEIKKFRVQVDDVIITKDSETADDIGVPALVHSTADDLICGYHLSILRADHRRMIGPFLYWHLLSKKSQEDFGNAANGVTRYGLTLGGIKSIPINLPDLPTQRAIADFLDRETARIDLLIEKKQRLVELLGEQRSSIISSAVTVGFDKDAELVVTGSNYLPYVPSTWRVWRLKHLADIRGGLTLGRQIPTDTKTILTPYMRVANVQSGWLNLSDVAETPVTESEQIRYRLKNGDVLMNEGGDNDKLGRGAVWRSEIETCVHQNHVFSVRPFNTDLSDWISLATNTRYARNFFYLHSNQSTNLASISKTNLSKFPIAIPPFNEMRSTTAILWKHVNKLDGVSEKTNTSINRLKEYRSALITAAVTGQIDVTEHAKSETTDRRLDAIQEKMGG